MSANESAPDPTAGEFPQGGRCRQFWRYTGQGEAPEQVAMECNVHGVIESVTAADFDQTIADAWADHLRDRPATPDADDASERLTEAERLAVREDLWSALAVEPTEPEMNLVERTFLGLIAAREAAAATKARAEGHRDGYELARSDMVSGAFVGGPTFEALRDSFTGQRIITDERERIAQAIEADANGPRPGSRNHRAYAGHFAAIARGDA